MENNAILSALSARKSVRVFTPDPVTPDERAAILNAAFQAPTAGNQQLYTILDITDPALKATLADLCDHQPFIAGAPLVLVFLADCRRWLNAYHAETREKLLPLLSDDATKTWLEKATAPISR